MRKGTDVLTDEDVDSHFCMVVKEITKIILLILDYSEYADVHYLIASILEAYSDHPVAVELLYVSTADAGT